MTPIRPNQPGVPDSAALLRFVSGRSPLPEAEAIRSWIAADPDRRASIAELRAAWQSTPAAAPEWDRDGVWAKLSTELAGTTSRVASEASRGHTPRRFAAHRSLAPRRWTSPAAKAAAIVVLLGTGAALVLPSWRTEAVEMREITTTHGERTVTELADGSRVTLDAASRLRVPTDLGVGSHRLLFWRARTPRRVELSGRALFDVKHDDARPFIVETATAMTQDVGTSFVIAAYPEALATEVAVVDGSVALWDRPSVASSSATVSDANRRRKTQPLMLLAAGDVGTLDTNGTATRRRGVPMESYVSWTRGVLRFDQTPLRDVVAQLGRWYDLDIRLADSALGARRLTAEVRTETAREALRRIGLTLDANVELHGRMAVLSPRTSATARRGTAR
jgi:transmembrane sensor